MSSGKVWLVGAGPGDASLITVKGLRVLKEAHVVVYDRLVSDELLKEIPASGIKINVGKEVNHHSVPQSEINNILIQYAKKGMKVVRLKGGDPYVFGRGGEEAEKLMQAGIPCEIVPGITSAIGGLACAGIPVTHRHHSSSVHIVTGHMCRENQKQDWATLAKLSGTLVILMGMGQIEAICADLLQAGKPATTPAAIVMLASRPQQQILRATLGTLVHSSHCAGFHAPALIVIGDVANIADLPITIGDPHSSSVEGTVQ